MTLGIVGLGSIGTRVAELGHALGMKIVGHTRSSRVRDTDAPIELLPLRDLFRRADIVSLHCPQTLETMRLVHAGLLAEMKQSAWLINSSRGGLIDEAAAASALREGRLAAAAVDVVSTEPISADNPLLHAPNVLITPHIAWTTLAARGRVMQTTADNITAFLCSRPQNLAGKPGVGTRGCRVEVARS